ncbi:MAG: hypothetical protein R3C53_05540 [Pirellulaceae bacterium]
MGSSGLGRFQKTADAGGGMMGGMGGYGDMGGMGSMGDMGGGYDDMGGIGGYGDLGGMGGMGGYGYGASTIPSRDLVTWPKASQMNYSAQFDFGKHALGIPNHVYPREHVDIGRAAQYHQKDQRQCNRALSNLCKRD